MDHRIVSASARPVARTIAAVTAASIVTALATSLAWAQQPPAAKPSAAPAPAAPKPPAATPAKPPAAAPAKPAAGTPAAPDEKTVKMPQLMYSEWIKFCVVPGQAEGEGSGAVVAPAGAGDAAKQVCLTGIDGRMESGMPIVAVVAIAPTAADGKKVLRVTLPVGMHIQHGTRFIIDQNPPLTAPYVTCFPNGCISDYDLSADTLGKMKKGKAAVVQGINYDGSAISVPVPLGEFAKAYDGPPTDPKVLAERQKKLEDELKRKGEELQKKAEEARQKLEQGPAKPQ